MNYSLLKGIVPADSSKLFLYNSMKRSASCSASFWMLIKSASVLDWGVFFFLILIQCSVICLRSSSFNLSYANMILSIIWSDSSYSAAVRKNLPEFLIDRIQILLILFQCQYQALFLHILQNGLCRNTVNPILHYIILHCLWINI